MEHFSLKSIGIVLVGLGGYKFGEQLFASDDLSGLLNNVNSFSNMVIRNDEASLRKINKKLHLK